MRQIAGKTKSHGHKIKYAALALKERLGRNLTHAPSKHTQTNVEVIQKFLNTDIKLENNKDGTFMIEVNK